MVKSSDIYCFLMKMAVAASPVDTSYFATHCWNTSIVNDSRESVGKYFNQ